MSIHKRNLAGLIASLLLLGVVAGCAESNDKRANRLEPMLSQAGFRALPADTPARADKLSQMKPLRVSYFNHNGKPVYWFPDPYVCHCLYRGDLHNYEKYEDLKAQASNEQREEAASVDDQASQQTYIDYMGSPAGQVFYGE
jgi:hypothetical protein